MIHLDLIKRGHTRQPSRECDTRARVQHIGIPECPHPAKVCDVILGTEVDTPYIRVLQHDARVGNSEAGFEPNDHPKVREALTREEYRCTIKVIGGLNIWHEHAGQFVAKCPLHIRGEALRRRRVNSDEDARVSISEARGERMGVRSARRLLLGRLGTLAVDHHAISLATHHLLEQFGSMGRNEQEGSKRADAWRRH
jgi:hypothetical protein